MKKKDALSFICLLFIAVIFSLQTKAQGFDQSIDAAVEWNNNKVYIFKGNEYIRYTNGAISPDADYPKSIAEWGFPSSFNNGIDAGVRWESDKVLFFKGHQYIQYTIGASRPDDGYPKSVAELGLPSPFNYGIDAAVSWEDNKVFFFKGNQYVRYTNGASRPDADYPKSINEWDFPNSFSNRIDAAAGWESDKVYFFKGDQYIQYTIGASSPDAGYPKQVAELHFPESFYSGMDAIVSWDDDNMYFFKEQQHLRYSTENIIPDQGYPRQISEWNFPSPFDTGIDAAVEWDNNKVYFFKGSQYLQYTIGASSPDPDYPRDLSNWNFPSPFNTGIDAAVRWINNNSPWDEKVYFFKGNQYLQYTIGASSPDPDYPRDISELNMPAPFNSGIDAAINWKDGKAYFFKGNQYIRYTIGASSPDADFPKNNAIWRFYSSRSFNFLATGDPQLNNNPWKKVKRYDERLNPVAIRTMRHIMANELDDNQRGLIIAGDLTQNARKQEFRWYKRLIKDKKELVYDGLGNHDYKGDWDISPDNWPVAPNIRKHVWSRSRSTPTNASNQNFNYSWDWDDVHFVQLNLYPCDDNEARSILTKGLDGHDCNQGLTWLKEDLAAKVGNSGRPVILIHHYGFDNLSIQKKNGVIHDNEAWWTIQERSTYWNAIADYNVIGIFTGHIHSGIGEFHKEWERPSNRTNGPTHIDTFVTGGCVESSYYLKVEVEGNEMLVIQMEDKRKETAEDNTANRNPVGEGLFGEKDRVVITIR